MNNCKWTPGPWVKCFNGHFWDIGLSNDSSEIPVYPCVCIGVPNDKKAEADLIAAAPELYEALKACVEGEFACTDKDAVAMAEAAMSKARGEA